MYKWDTKCTNNSDDNEIVSDGKKSTNTVSSGSLMADRWVSIVGHINDESLLEDEVVPDNELCLSSPDTNRFENFDNTLLEPEPKWKSVSDESFVRMEALVRSPLASNNKKNDQLSKYHNDSNLITFSPLQRGKELSKCIEEDETTDTISINDYETCESGSSKVDDVPQILLNSRLCHNTLEDVESLSCSDAIADTGHPSSLMEDNPLYSSQTSVDDEVLKFNDTLEEMEHLIKYGMSYMTSNVKEAKDGSKDNTQASTLSLDHIKSDVSSSSIERDTRNEIIYEPITNVRVMVKKDKENKFFNSPDPSVSPYKIPKKSPVKCRKFFYKSPPSAKNSGKFTPSTKTPGKLTPSTKISLRLTPSTKTSLRLTPATKTSLRLTPSTKTPARLTPSVKTPARLTPSKTPGKSTPSNTNLSKFDNILSPVQYYIKNSPIVPKIKNVSPGFNLWETHSRKAPSTCLPVSSPRQEPSLLKEKAYKSAKTTCLIETPPKARLPRNFKVGLMAEALPKPTVIKHERREKFTQPLREQNKNTKQSENTKFSGVTVEESFANLHVTSGDVSLCIKKPATRSRTLK